MSFNIGLSGLRAATKDLNVTGNNIANAGTAGFKQSRAEFADVYAASVLGSGSNPQGSGVLLGDISQQFNQWQHQLHAERAGPGHQRQWLFRDQ